MFEHVFDYTEDMDVGSALRPGPDAPWSAEELLPGLEQLASSSRIASRRAARDAIVLAGLAARVPRVAGDERGASAWTSFLREVAVARRCSDRGASSEVARSVQLVRMPVTLDLLHRGELPEAHARALVEETWTAGARALAAIDAEVGPRAVLLSPSRVRDAARKVLLREEADAVAARAAKAAALRNVRRRPLADDQAEIVITGPAVPVAQAYDALDAQARALRAAGDGRSLDALRFDLAASQLGCGGGDGVRGGGGGGGGAATAPAGGSASPGPASLGTGAPIAPATAAPGTGAPVAPAAVSPVTGAPVAPATAAPASFATVPAAPAAAIGDAAWLSDRRCSRPVRLNVQVPVTTLLGLSHEPGWLDGHGWISAPTCRQLLVSAELRRLCVDETTGRLLDLSDTVVRPELSPEAVGRALQDMASAPVDLADAVWEPQPEHDPGPRLREFVVLRDGMCDGPTGARVAARRAHLDHDIPWPLGPTAAWNLVARGERTHLLKHRGWTPVRTPSSTLWFSPAGQVVEVPLAHEPLQPLESDAVVPDPVRLHQLEAELLRPPTLDDDPPDW
ncbi:MAG: endonuclease [Frankiales bacterium]|nr:endonuclease [Frankiales bacterium]